MSLAGPKSQTQRKEASELTHDDFDEHDARAMIVSSSAYLLIAIRAAGHGTSLGAASSSLGL
jgi:hypothetical protein